MTKLLKVTTRSLGADGNRYIYFHIEDLEYVIEGTGSQDGTIAYIKIKGHKAEIQVPINNWRVALKDYYD